MIPFLVWLPEKEFSLRDVCKMWLVLGSSLLFNLDVFFNEGSDAVLHILFMDDLENMEITAALDIIWFLRLRSSHFWLHTNCYLRIGVGWIHSTRTRRISMWEN